MLEIELSVMENQVGAEAELRRLLDQFEAEHHFRVNVRVLQWNTAWAEIMNYGLYQRGPDVSEIGSTWVGSMAGMNALRPYKGRDIGESAVFLPSVWKGGLLHGDNTPWAIPWLADTRLIYYHRDLLEQAGVVSKTAFASIEAMEQTLSRLPKDTGVSPWVMPTRNTYMTIHNLATWLWEAGGDFIDPDTKQVLLTRPNSVTGMLGYFNLIRYMLPKAQGLDEPQAYQLFQDRQAAVLLAGPWLYLGATAPKADETVRVAVPPGVPFVGGTNLVIWNYAKYQRERAALELVRFLTSLPVQAAYCKALGRLPVRLDVLEDAEFAEHPIYQVVTQALKQGRSFPAIPDWGTVEDRVVPTLNDIWRDLLANPTAEVETVIRKNIEPMARRLEITLQRGKGT